MCAATLSFGSPCTRDAECTHSLGTIFLFGFCDKRTSQPVCAPQLEFGDVCDLVNAHPCESGFHCDTSTLRCTNATTSAAGSSDALPIYLGIAGGAVVLVIVAYVVFHYCSPGRQASAAPIPMSNVIWTTLPPPPYYPSGVIQQGSAPLGPETAASVSPRHSVAPEKGELSERVVPVPGVLGASPSATPVPGKSAPEI